MEDSQQLSCDTLPVAQRLSHTTRPSRFEPRSLAPQPEEGSTGRRDDSPVHGENRPHADNAHTPIRHSIPTSSVASAFFNQPPPRQLCVRHKRMADEGVSLKLQKSLDALPVPQRETVSTLWSMFSSSTHAHRHIILQGLLTMCCSSQLSLLNEQVPQLLRIDPFFAFPRELSLRVLKYLDAKSLTRAAQVSRSWRSIADDDLLWRNLCEQHIEKLCTGCGWGLPLLERRRLRGRSQRSTTTSVSSSTVPRSPHASRKRSSEDEDESATNGPLGRSCKRPKLPEPSASHDSSQEPVPATLTRPWKDVYCERQKVEKNWRRGRCSVRTLKGHTNGVMCLQYSDTLSKPTFPILMTGSFDRTVRIWNVETGCELKCLQGHQRVVRALQFDERILITASMDKTLKVWDWRNGECIRTLEGHTEGVISLAFDDDVLVSGSVDATVKVWNLRTGESHTLYGHRDWINAVLLWDGMPVPRHTEALVPDPGARKLVFSASDDGAIRLWDLSTRECIRELTGHMAQVQSIKLAYMEGDDGDDEGTENGSIASLPSGPPVTGPVTHWEDKAAAMIDEEEPGSTHVEGEPVHRKRGPYAVLISGSLDNTMKMWDIESGTCLKTYFGHIEGLWAVAVDKRHIVSASHDRTIKIWYREGELSAHTLVGHRAAVTCLEITDDKIISGSDDGDIRIWSFAPERSGPHCQHPNAGVALPS